MRHKPRYNDLFLTYKDKSGEENGFYCSEVSTNKRISSMLGMPVKDSGARYITTSDLNFVIDGVIIEGEVKHRILTEPDTKPLKDGNSRRGQYLKVRVIETS